MRHCASGGKLLNGLAERQVIADVQPTRDQAKCSTLFFPTAVGDTMSSAVRPRILQSFREAGRAGSMGEANMARLALSVVPTILVPGVSGGGDALPS